MKATADRPASPAPVRLLNVIFWQLSGVVIGAAIGALMPFLAFTLAPRRSVSLEEGMVPLVFFAVLVAFITAAVGGILGTLIGIKDRTSFFAPRRKDTTASEQDLK
jgi:hypothetical protein